MNVLPRGVIEVCLCHHLRRAARVVTRLFDEALVPSGINANQFNVLVAIASLPEASAARIARKLGMDRTTLSRNLKPLRRVGLIETGGGAGRRPDTVILTAAGERALEDAIIHWQTAQSRLSTQLGSANAGHLLTLLTRTADGDL
jgi:DNA-binding MarR family transcriptional regulator